MYTDLHPNVFEEQFALHLKHLRFEFLSSVMYSVLFEWPLDEMLC